MAVPVPARDVDLEAAVSEADRELAGALAELATLRSASRARGEEVAALRRAEAAREAEAETARRRLAEAERRAAEEREAALAANARRDEVTARHDAARGALEAATTAEAGAREKRETARVALDTADAERAAAAERLASMTATTAALRARVDGLAAQLEEGSVDRSRAPLGNTAAGGSTRTSSSTRISDRRWKRHSPTVRAPTWWPRIACRTSPASAAGCWSRSDSASRRRPTLLRADGSTRSRARAVAG
jgi:hypothetical protein